MAYSYTQKPRDGSKKANQVDASETRANLATQITARATGQTSPAAPTQYTNALASFISALRTGTTNLVKYTGGAGFPWSESITQYVSKIKARHLEEIRQVVDDAVENQRCNSGCLATCGVACTYACTSTCAAGCSSSCSTACVATCTGQCYTNCTGGCTGSCTDICTGTCSGNCYGEKIT